MKTLCLYYSRTNTTKKAMEQLAKLTGADLYEYSDGKDRRGIPGYIGACIDSLRRKYPKVYIKGNPDLSSYDRVIIGMPVWAEAPCIVGRALLKQYRKKMSGEVYYVVTHMAKADYLKKIKAMDSLLGRPSKGQISLRTKKHDYLKEIKVFSKKFIIPGFHDWDRGRDAVDK